MRHFILIKELHYIIEGLWFSACDCGFDTGSTKNSVPEPDPKRVLAKTDASNSRA